MKKPFRENLFRSHWAMAVGQKGMFIKMKLERSLPTMRVEDSQILKK